MYNRYQGNSGRVERVPDAPQPVITPRLSAAAAANAANFLNMVFLLLVCMPFSPWPPLRGGCLRSRLRE